MSPSPPGSRSSGSCPGRTAAVESKYLLRSGARLFRERRTKRLLSLRDIRLVAVRIDERHRNALLQSSVLGVHIEVAAMRTEEDVGRQGLHYAERLLEVVDDVRIERVRHELVPSVDVRAADDHDV